MPRVIGIVAAAMVGLLAVAAAPASAQQRIALLIGNQAYTRDIGALGNPHNDIALLERTLKALGFEVTVVRDAGLAGLHQAVNGYTRRLRAAGPDAVGFFYYSGHGAADGATNYLIPVDVKSIDDSELWDKSLRLTEITRKLKAEAGTATHFVVFDACRNVLKIRKAGTRAIVQSKGFVSVSQEPGMLIAYATAEGELASDVGTGAGPYAKVLAEELVRPGIEAVTMFRNVQRRVRAAINQEPYLGFNALGDIYFAGPAAGEPQRPAVATPAPPPKASPPVVISGSARTACADLKAIVEQADRDFAGIRKGGSAGDTWETPAKLHPFKACQIRKLNAMTFNCEAPPVANQAKAREQMAQLATAAETCLGSGWRKNVLYEDAIGLNHAPSNTAIIYAVFQSFNFQKPNSNEHYASIQVYRNEATAPVARKEDIKPAKKPEGYCDGLKQVVTAAKTQFDDIIGRKRAEKSWMTKVSLEGWAGCYIAELKANEKGSRYLTCELAPYATADDAEAMSEEIAGDLKACLGQGWLLQRRRSASGQTNLEYVSSEVETTVEIRSRENFDKTWEVKIDVNVKG